MKMTIRSSLVVLILFLTCCIFGPPLAAAQPRTHIVQKGDTLWDLCEKYYGDTDLWPKLWQMNPFITNPHLIKPGEIIVLLEAEPIKEMEAPEEKDEVPVEVPAEPKVAPTGIDLSQLVNVKALGYLSRTKVEPWGHIFDSDSTKIIIAEGEKVMVKFVARKAIQPGDEFAICHLSDLLRHPLNGKKLGYLLSVVGMVVIKEHAKEDFYKAEIAETFRAVNVGDMIIPYEPVSPCIQPKPVSREFVENIVAVKNELKLIGQYSVVYLDRGLKQGIRRGDMFEVVRTRQIPDLPDVSLGHLIVVDSRVDTATALVLTSQQEFPNGSCIKGLPWVEPPDSLLKVYSCSTQ